MDFKFGRWYIGVDSDPRVSDLEIFTLPLSSLYIMMVAVDMNKLVPPPGNIGFMVNVIEDIVINGELVAAEDKKNGAPASDLELARKELENVIESFHKSALKYDDVLTKKEDECGEEN